MTYVNVLICLVMFFFFFNDTATTEIYTLSLHDALPISLGTWPRRSRRAPCARSTRARGRRPSRSEEHTSELQSRLHLVCRLLLEKKKKDMDGNSSQCQLIEAEREETHHEVYACAVSTCN